MHETRSAGPAGAQQDWIDGYHNCESVSIAQGVGARQCESFAPGEGGGYLGECTPSQLWEDAKFRELDRMGLPQVWLDVARDIGYDAFMTMWRRLDSAIELRSEAESMIEVKLRRYASFQRYQRNRFIETLVSMGCSSQEIRARVRTNIGEELSLHHIRRLVKQLRTTVNQP
ncbi:hypothetical protein KW843_07670 [Acidovorax sp. sif1233]|uniref:hypothetical protein n=1 Tax=Acidovorax sp. sif1233 TaxID=2854792 RepID=UPI001C493176|nr:hypothetical protein [Acidovorax sp. sif1233]MBV7454345.1 hypothetical protein [Acidovorax sp. sif1233]